jgi:hypothetical protein
MVVPGIGGSVLADDRGVVWAAGIGDVAGLLVDPERLDLGSVEWLRPRGLIGSRSLCPGWTVVHGYDGLLDLLGRLDGALVDRAAGDDPGVRVPGATVVAFPYDFRRSIVDAAELLGAEVDRRLSDLGGARSKRVIVVAHSTGGLVARYWLGPLGGWRVCRALVTAGTPHRGAVKALRMLVDGPGVGPFRADGVRELFRGWRSVYELLPTYKAVWDAAEGAVFLSSR